jgi:hypothetical protein
MEMDVMRGKRNSAMDQYCDFGIKKRELDPFREFMPL